MEDNNEGNENPDGDAALLLGINENNDNDDNQADEADEDENENDGEADGEADADGGNNDNIMIDVDIEEDEEDGDNDSTYDGGVATNPDVNPEEASSKAKKHSSECDLLLYIYCQEPIDVAPDHPILRPGVTVSIGLDKTTKLKAVFKQYVDFCNSKSKTDSPESDSTQIDVQDLEFAFCQLLNENDTAETSALMKNDRIRVRKVQKSERVIEAERKRAQRESDKVYFQQMRHLLPESCPTRLADVILDCQGKLVDNDGHCQRVLSTTVRAHSSLIRKRCPWLMAIILKARQKAKQQLEQEETQNSKTPDHSSTRATEIENDDEGETCNDNGQANNNNSENDEKEIARGEEEISRAARIDMEDDCSVDGNVNVIIVDDDEDDSNHVVSSSRHQIHSRPEVDALTVVLSEHSPEAVKILLEYCYTNRVVSLGHNAFVQACKTRPNKHNGPVPPHPTTHSSNARKWPNNGISTIPFSVALAAIRLAEEAGMFRLSFMCEISAAQLVTTSNVVEALTMSTRQKIISGNDLSRLRKAAMDVIFKRGRRGVSEIGRSSCFKKALEEERSIIVPTLLKGTMEAVAHWEKAKGSKRDLSEISRRSCFKDIDSEDAYKRSKERNRRRQDCVEKDASKIHEQDDEHLNDFSDEPYDEFSKSWAAGAGASKRSLSRMVHHNMDSIRRQTFSRVEMNLPKPDKKRSRRSRSDGFFANREK